MHLKLFMLAPYSSVSASASTETSSGENIDVYFWADPVFVGEWCTENSYIFPYDITDLTIAPKLLIWGCVYNTVSGEITHVKAYTREEAD